MNLLILALVAGACLAGLWLVQSAYLLALREPLAPPLRYKSVAPSLRWTMRLMVQLCWVAILIAVPFAIGTRPSRYFARAFPAPDWGQLAVAFALALVVFALAYVVQFAAGWLAFAPQGETTTRRRKLVRRLAAFIPIAGLEEAVFRGLLLEQVYQALPGGLSSATLAIAVSSAAFSAAHFIRPHLNVRQPALGLFAVGVVVGTAYIAGGRSLWLPIALHAAGILYAEVTKLYTSYRGPARFVGTPVFPHCGIVGITALSLLTVLVVAFFSQPLAWKDAPRSSRTSSHVRAKTGLDAVERPLSRWRTA